MSGRESDLNVTVMDDMTFNRTMGVLHQAVSEGAAASMVIGVWTKADPLKAFVGGVGPSVNAHSVFDLASVSKVIGTMAALALLIERRHLGWNTQAQSILPEYPDPAATLLHLVSHTAGWVWWKPVFEELRVKYGSTPIETIPISVRQADTFSILSKLKPEHSVGTNCTYSDISMIWAQYLIERLTQKPLDHFIEKEVWPWLGIESAYYQRVDRPNLAVTNVIETEMSEWRRRRLQGVVHDDNCYAMGGYGGHAGVFSEMSALLWYGRQILSGFFSSEVVRGFFHRVSSPVECMRTAGWDTPSGPQPSIGRYFSDASIGHLGYTGTSLWIDPVNEITVGLLSNRVYYGRENEKLKLFRPMIHDELALDLKALGLMA